MATAKRSFSINRLIGLFNDGLNKDESIALNLALQSLAKRLKYCEYHYQLYLENSTPSKLARERSGIPYNNLIRVKYEANFLAFLNNLHCIVDAIPYVLNIVYQRSTEKDINHKSVSWRDAHINLYRKEHIYPMLNLTKNCEAFIHLRELSNRSKHKHLTPISNRLDSLIIEGFSYLNEGRQEITVPPINVDEFMETCHNSLIPLVVSLFNEVMSIKEKSTRTPIQSHHKL